MHFQLDGQLGIDHVLCVLFAEEPGGAAQCMDKEKELTWRLWSKITNVPEGK